MSQRPPAIRGIRRDLLAWYDRECRRLPWRAPPGDRASPYEVWLSEIMLQQTTVATVIPYYDRFVARWPTVEDLASADLDAVLHAWQGLGYYARARNLHRCARIVARERGGRFPETEAALRVLPGIGTYTAAAVAAIAFGRPATPVDGNVERVVARLFAVDAPPPAGKRRVRALAESLTPKRRPGDFWQAVMDLGAGVCTPRAPACEGCPVSGWCGARRVARPEDIPPRKGKPARPSRHGVAFWLADAEGAVLLRRRPASGLLGGMMEVPSTAWRESPWTMEEAEAAAPVAAEWRPVAGVVRHTFTHFHLSLIVLAARVEGAATIDGTWCPPERFDDYALPTVMRKVIRSVLAAESRGV
jgi:A/G-specific adenine glycosylase